MSNQARLFVAIKIIPSRPMRRVLSQLGMVGRAVKVMSADNLHLTLKFLGDTDLELAPQISDSVKTAVDGQPAFSMQLKGLGVFPNVCRPSVVWVGTPGEGPVMEIAASLEQQLEPLGFSPERRAYHPHVTVARIRSKPPDELAEMLERDAATEFGSIDVASVELYQSELRLTGPRYTVLSRFELLSE